MDAAPNAGLEVDLAEIGRRCLCLQSRMTARAVTRHYNAVLAPLGLEVTEFSLLASLATGRDPSISQLADRLAFERTTLVRSLRRLADRGLVQTAAGGGRAVRYVLTGAGEDLLVRAIPLWRQAQAGIEGRLESTDGELVRASLRRLRHATRTSDLSRKIDPPSNPPMKARGGEWKTDPPSDPPMGSRGGERS